MENKSPYSEKVLLAAIADDDESAFRRIFDQYRDKIYYFTRKFIKSDVVAEDILQEIFLKIWINRKKLPEIENFKAYLYTLTRNYIYNTLRKQANEELFLQTLPSGLNETAAPAKTFDNIALHELQYALQKATAALTPQQKQVFEMSRIEGLKHKEIAVKLGVSQNTVKKHIADALRTIRFEMQSYNRFVQLAILLFLVHF